MNQRNENEILSRRARRLIGLSLAVVVVGSAVGFGARHALGGELYQGFAVPADGGTLKLYALPARSDPAVVRLWGVYVPRVDAARKCQARPEQEQDRLACGGRAAMRGLWTILLSSPEGTVSCDERMRENFDGDLRVYGRCVLPDGERDVAEIMLRNGWGLNILPAGATEPPFEVAARYAAAEKDARRDRVGLWSDEK